MKKAFYFLTGIIAGVFGIMLYLHRSMIIAALKGEEMPKAPESCPAFSKEDYSPQYDKSMHPRGSKDTCFCLL